MYGLLTLTVAKTRFEIDHLDEDYNRSVATFLNKERKLGNVGSRAWKTYLSSWRSLKNYGQDKFPEFEDVKGDLGVSLYYIREHAISKISSYFESFSQCWALNYLISIVESSISLNRKQNTLLIDLSTDRKRRALPYIYQIIETFPDVEARLRNLPHISTDMTTGKKVETPVSINCSALDVIYFWREFRNSFVHGGSIMSSQFVKEKGEIFDVIRQPFGTKLKSLQVGSRLQLPSDMFYATLSTHLKTAACMNDMLKCNSEGWRGNIYLPNEDKLEPTKFMNFIQPKPLLMPVDLDHRRTVTR